MDLLKLDRYSSSFPNSLSRGTLQRMNIALGIIRDEDLILMDEPFITLDPVQVSIVEDLILKDGKLLEYSPNEIDKNNISKLINDSYGD